MITAAALLSLMLAAGPAPAPLPAGASVAATRHNLSASGAGSLRAQSEDQICLFCHVPHRGLSGASNRRANPVTYVPYSSSTMSSPAPGAPTGASRVCLSCHDGTLALGQTVASGTIAMRGVGAGAVGLLGGASGAGGRSNLGTDLRGSHPVSFRPAEGAELHNPPPGDPVQLDAQGQLQCTSCHDPHNGGHDPQQGDFLAKSNLQSALCTTCHAKAHWAANPSAHQASLKRFDERLGASTRYGTVRDNGCESCHRPHGAVPEGSRLLRDTAAETCLVCHRGQVAEKNLEVELRKPYAHPVLTSDQALHDPAEGPLNPARRLPEVSAASPRHVTCADCHNPHAAFSREARAPAVPGSLSGVWGIERGGGAVALARFEYEVCFKCHGDSANQPQARTGSPETLRRAVPDANLRRLLDSTSAASFHPVEAPGRNPDVPSLLPPWTTASMVYCSDCHGSESPTGPRGPHGSVYRHLLVARLETAAGSIESPQTYALCYRCHDRTSILSDQTFSAHQSHVVGSRAACSTCHDSHGVSSLQGNPVNGAHLINFDVAVVRPNSKGLLRYSSGGARSGTCALTCHGVEHDESRYGPGLRPRRTGLGRAAGAR